MLTDEQIADALNLIDSRYHDVIIKYLQKVGKTIKEIGHFNQSSINLLIQLRRMGVDVATIERELQKVTRLTKQDIRKLYQRAAQEATTDARIEYLTKGVEPDSVRWNDLVEGIWKQTAGAMDNLSNNTVITEGYRSAVDDAVQAVTMGATDYNSAVRDAVRRIGRDGLQVEYESTYLAADGQMKHRKRRLDSAVRQNVLDGIRQVQQKAQEMIGEEIGADGVDISAHLNSAPDHEPVQGRRFDLDNFQRMQSGQDFEDVDGNHYTGFERPITEWRCRHLIFYILLSVSRRLYTDEQLEGWKAANQKGCIIDGKEYTNYEATQLMRSLETEIRKQKDTAVLAQAAGDDVLRRECQSKINKLTKKYNYVAEAAGLRKRMDKTRVEGYEPLPEARFRDNVAILPPVKGDAITHRKLHNDLSKSDIGKETIDFINSGKCIVEVNYTDEAPKGTRGETIGRFITIYANNTRTVKLTAKTLIHEVTHCKYGISGDQWSEAMCFAREAIHEKGALTYQDLRNIIKTVKELYPEYKWRKGSRKQWKG